MALIDNQQPQALRAPRKSPMKRETPDPSDETTTKRRIVAEILQLHSVLLRTRDLLDGELNKDRFREAFAEATTGKQMGKHGITVTVEVGGGPLFPRSFVSNFFWQRSVGVDFFLVVVGILGLVSKLFTYQESLVKACLEADLVAAETQQMLTFTAIIPAYYEANDGPQTLLYL